MTDREQHWPSPHVTPLLRSIQFNDIQFNYKDRMFDDVDMNRDRQITFKEWREYSRQEWREYLEDQQDHEESS